MNSAFKETAVQWDSGTLTQMTVKWVKMLQSVQWVLNLTMLQREPYSILMHLKYYQDPPIEVIVSN